MSDQEIYGKLFSTKKNSIMSLKFGLNDISLLSSVKQNRTSKYKYNPLYILSEFVDRPNM